MWNIEFFLQLVSTIPTDEEKKQIWSIETILSKNIQRFGGKLLLGEKRAPNYSHDTNAIPYLPTAIVNGVLQEWAAKLIAEKVKS